MSASTQRFIFLVPIFLSILAVSNCASYKLKSTTSIPPAPLADGDNFGSPPALMTVEQIFKLNKQQKDDFNAFFYAHQNSSLTGNKRIYRYLQRYVKNYIYFNKTLTAQQSLQQAQGNCLSLAILTTALAKAVGVDTGYQLVESAPIYQKEGEIIISSQHVRSLLFAPKETIPDGFFQYSRAGVIIDYFPTAGSHIKRSVMEPEFIAMYYRNSAADSIINKDYNLAYWQLTKALQLYPADEHAINMLAVVHEKKGLFDYADKLYRYGLRYSNEKLDLLRNYHQFLRKQKRFSEAKNIKTKLATMKVVNPFDWINLGHIAFVQQQFSEAKHYYKKALKIAPYLHQGYLGVAKAEFKLGNFNASKASMRLAKKNAFDIKTRDLYQRKISALANY
jgi:Tfp pilus assembly protein PilF